MRDTQKGKLDVFRLSWKPPWCMQFAFSNDPPHFRKIEVLFGALYYYMNLAENRSTLSGVQSFFSLGIGIFCIRLMA